MPEVDIKRIRPMDENIEIKHETKDICVDTIDDTNSVEALEEEMTKEDICPLDSLEIVMVTDDSSTLTLDLQAGPSSDTAQTTDSMLSDDDSNSKGIDDKAYESDISWISSGSSSTNKQSSHIQRRHKNKRPRFSDHNKNIKDIQTKIKKTFICRMCGYKGTTKYNLKLHLTSHDNYESHNCNVCKYVAAYKSDLIKHMRTHTGEKPYSCNMCNYSSGKKETLTVHMRIHTGEKPYKCTICPFSAAMKNNLTRHMLTHNGKKPYSCQLCNYITGRKENLAVHMRTHTGEKPYSCSICSYTATLKQSIKKHLKTHSPKTF